MLLRCAGGRISRVQDVRRQGGILDDLNFVVIQALQATRTQSGGSTRDVVGHFGPP